MSRTTRITYLPALDGLRGLAVVGVLLFHAGHLSGGFLGVDLFFTLSGFLITSLLIAEWQRNGSVSRRAFWARRARRLLPALFLTLIGVAIYARVWALPAELQRIRADGLAALLYVANWHFIVSGRGYWESFNAPSPLEHMWSLAIEEQFYLVWPLVFVLVMKLAKGRLPVLFGVATSLAVGSAVLMVVLHHPGDDPTRVYMGSDTRAFSILTGVALAALVAWRGLPRTRAGQHTLEAVGAVTFTLLLVAWFRIDGLRSNGLFEGGLFLCSIAAAVTIAAVARPKGGVLRRLLANKPLVYLGAISYGLYLWHWPIYVVLTESRTDLHGWTLTGARLAASVVVASASYWLIEHPIRRGALTGWSVRLALPSAVLCVVAALMWSTVGATTPGSALGPPPDGGTGDPSAATSSPAPPTTVAGNQRVLIVGDSVALTVGAGAEKVGPSMHVDVLNRGFLGCGLSRADGEVRLRDGQVVTEHEDCHNWPTRWASELEAFRPTAALLLLGAWDLADRRRGGEWQHPCQADFDSWYTGEAREALRVLAGTGAAVSVTTLPYIRGDVLGLAKGEVDDRVDCLNRSLREAVTGSSATLVALDQWVCPAGKCVAKVDGETLRPDGVHYDGPGGPIVARWLLGQLQYNEVPTEPPPESTTTAPAPAPPTTTNRPRSSDARLVMAGELTGGAVGRTLSASHPLRVLVVGDSIMHDAQLGIEAALHATGVVHMERGGIVGFGLQGVYPWRTEWPRLLAQYQPELIVAMWGGWDDALLKSIGPDGYRARLAEAIGVLGSAQARIAVIGMPASNDGWFEPRDAPREVNRYFAELPGRYPGQVVYLDGDAIVAPGGRPMLTIGRERVRKADLNHVCPDGAARFG
ncbi:MAG TPA: acyltransferase family protein, partial [Acidimicrobiales bacterium]